MSELDDFAFRIIWKEASEIFQELETKGRLEHEMYWDDWEVEEGWLDGDSD